MATYTLTSREFNQNLSYAKREALKGPVFITDRGRPAYVLLSVAEYQRIADQEQSIISLLAMPDAADIEFEVPPLKSILFGSADLS
ncbi:type II toxin-antitoxin system Phd/YefM family antitoxin [Porticoccaceae bacterium]|nr:type II toxin-antitoxin system Phd/YefM family antitoxin [Porticoccaceae bacterium]